MAKKSSTIDLGRKYDSPSVNSDEAAKATSESKVHYPTLYVSDVESLKDMPDGEFTFCGKARVVSRTESTRDGKTKCSCELEIHSITPDAKPSSKSSVDGLSEALDK